MTISYAISNNVFFVFHISNIRHPSILEYWYHFLEAFPICVDKRKNDGNSITIPGKQEQNSTRLYIEHACL